MHAVIVYRLAEDGGRRVQIDGELSGRAFGLRDVVEFLRRAGLEDVDEVGVAGADWIEWRGGGPDDWERGPGYGVSSR